MVSPALPPAELNALQSEPLVDFNVGGMMFRTTVSTLQPFRCLGAQDRSFPCPNVICSHVRPSDIPKLNSPHVKQMQPFVQTMSKCDFPSEGTESGSGQKITPLFSVATIMGRESLSLILSTEFVSHHVPEQRKQFRLVQDNWETSSAMIGFLKAMVGL